jgi:transglutaminase-like putative cysteine protease
MAGSVSQQERQANSRRWLIAAFLIYAVMVGSVAAYVAVHPDVPDETQAARARAATMSKPARYEGVIANWNRYRAKDARAEAR